MLRRSAVVLAASLVPLLAALGGGCGASVDCNSLCQRTLACEVSFAPSDDLNGDKIKDGERTDLESCDLGCQENPAVTVEAAQCVDEITNSTTDPFECQAPVLACFGAEVTPA